MEETSVVVIESVLSASSDLRVHLKQQQKAKLRELYCSNKKMKKYVFKLKDEVEESRCQEEQDIAEERANAPPLTIVSAKKIREIRKNKIR